MLKVLTVPNLRIAVLEHDKMQHSRPYRSKSGSYTGKVSILMLWIKDVPFSLQLSNSFLAPDDVDCLDAPVFAKVNHHPAQLRIGRTLYQGLSFGNLQTPTCCIILHLCTVQQPYKGDFEGDQFACNRRYDKGKGRVLS